MCSFVWCLSVLVLAAEVRSNVLDIKNIEVSRCHQCVGTNKTQCELGGLPSVLCPPERPLCATVATSPDFESSLTCEAPISSQCSLTYNGKFHLVCTCMGHLCNAPYTSQLRNELYNFSTKIPENTTVELAEIFLNSTVFANVTKAKLYKTITVQTLSPANFSSTLSASLSSSVIGPRAEALKHEATVSPDDEDDGEGSGTFDDKQVPSAPAAPSSFLPSEHNNSSKLFVFTHPILITISLHAMFVLKYS